MTSAADVVVIGAGPAGLAAAATIAKCGMHVQVFDRKQLPIDKVCGEGLMPAGLRFLEQVGAKTYLHPDDSFPFAGIRYSSPAGHVAQAEFAEGPGLGIRRTALSRALSQALAADPKVTLSDGIGVRAIRPGARQMEVVLDNGDAVACRLVVGADGLRSRVRVWTDLAGSPARRVRLGIRRHFEIAPWSRFVEVHAGDGVEAYATPCGPRRVGVAILWERDRAGDTAPGAGLFESLLDQLPNHRAQLNGALACSEPQSTGPLAQTVKASVARGVALIGDAAGYVDACTGEGLTLAFKQADALASCLVSSGAVAGDGVVSSEQLESYSRACRKIARSYVFGTRLMLRLYRHQRMLEGAIKLMASRPALLQQLLSFNMGTAPLHKGLLRALTSNTTTPDRHHARPA